MQVEVEVPSQVPSIPQDPLSELKTQKRWVCYRSVEDKQPLQPSGLPAKSNDSSTWSTYEDCVAAVATGKFHGLGFVLTNSGYVGVDFDDIRDPETGVINPVVLEVVYALDSYGEVSPSGTGLHVLVASTFSGGKKRPFIEIYGGESAKYFTVTGDHISGTPETINERTEQITQIFSTIDSVDTKIKSSVKALANGLLIAKGNKLKFDALMKGDWQAAGCKGVSEGVQSLLCLLAEKTNCNAEQMDAQFRQSGMYSGKWTDDDKWGRLGESEIATAIKFTLSLNDNPHDFGFGEFIRPAVKGTAFDFVFAPLDGCYDGWFPRGDTSVIAGSSGSAKTTRMFDMLRRQRDGETVHGHKTFSLPFLVCMADRGEMANERTLARMKINKNTFPLEHITATSLKVVLREIKDKIEAEHILPVIVFVEGADMLLEDASKMNLVAPFINALNKIARHYHIAFVLSIGAPKTKPKDKYVSQRASIFGSVAWGRMTETIITMETPNDDDTSDLRDMTVLLRQGSAERFHLKFNEHGQLEEIPPTIQTVDGSDLNQWVFNQAEWFTVNDAVKATSLHKNTVKPKLEALHLSGFIDRKPSGTKNQIIYRRKQGVIVSVGGKQ